MSHTTALNRPAPILLFGLLGCWLVAALVVGATGTLLYLPLPAPAFAILLAVVFLIALRLLPTLRAGAYSLGIPVLVGFHTVRIVAGANFLWLASRGVLPGEFALFAGWGDIAVGVGALLVLWLCLPVATEAQRIGLLAWNVLGLVDILLVLGNGARVILPDPTVASAFANLPLTLLPLFVVPLVIISHVLLFVWLPKPSRANRVER